MKKLFLKVVFLSLFIFSIISCKNITPEEKTGSITEANITLEYAKLLKESLEGYGFKVKLTRDDDNTNNEINKKLVKNII